MWTITGASHVARTFTSRLLGSFSWAVLSTLAMQGSVLVSSLLVARLIGIEDFGIYSVLVSTALTVAAVAQGGLGLVNTKFVAEQLHSDLAGVARTLHMSGRFTLWAGGVATCLLFVASPFIAVTILHKPQVEPLVRLVAVAVLFQTIATAHLGALQGFGAFEVLGRTSLISGVLFVLSCAAGAWLGGAGGALTGFSCACAIRSFLLYWALRKVQAELRVPPVHVQPGASEWRKLLSFALPAGISSLVTLPSLWGVTALVARQPDGLVWAGLFAVAHQLRTAVLQLPVLLNSVSFSVLSRLRGRGDVQAARHVFWTNVACCIGFALAIIGVLTILIDPVLKLYGPEFVRGRELVILLLVAIVPEIIGICAYQLIQISGAMWRSLFFIVGPRDVLYFILAAILLPWLGLIGAGWAYLIAYLFGCVATILIGRSRFAYAERGA